MYYCIRTLPVTVAEVPVGPTDNSKKKMNPAAKEAGDFSENEGGVLPGFMMEFYQVRFPIPTDNKNTVLLYKLGCLINIHMSKHTGYKLEKNVNFQMFVRSSFPFYKHSSALSDIR